MNPFWVVWNPDKGPPSKVHESLENATKEAQRIAEKELTPLGVYVLTAVVVIKSHVQLETTIEGVGDNEARILRQHETERR